MDASPIGGWARRSIAIGLGRDTFRERGVPKFWDISVVGQGLPIEVMRPNLDASSPAWGIPLIAGIPKPGVSALREYSQLDLIQFCSRAELGEVTPHCPMI